MRESINKKLNSNKGESLAEVLVAILITAVGVLMLSSLIYAATKIIDKGEIKIKEIYNGVTAMEEKAGAKNPGTLQLKRESNGQTKIIRVELLSDENSGLVSYEKREGE